MKHKREFSEKFPELIIDGIEVSILVRTAILPKIYLFKNVEKKQLKFDYSVSAFDKDNLLKVSLFFTKSFKAFMVHNSIDEFYFSKFLLDSLHITELYFGLNFASISSESFKEVLVKDFLINIEFKNHKFDLKVSVF